MCVILAMCTLPKSIFMYVFPSKFETFLYYYIIFHFKRRTICLCFFNKFYDVYWSEV